MIKSCFLILLIISYQSIACSIAPVIEPFEFTEGSSTLPDTPSFKTINIVRGEKRPGDSCEYAHITFQLNSEPKEATGYIFEIPEGNIRAISFPDYSVKRIRQRTKVGQYTFDLLDKYSIEQDPIDIIVKITAVSKTGLKSNPQFLKVRHPGVEKAWWKFW